MGKVVELQPIDSLVAYVHQRIVILSNNINGLQVPVDERAKDDYWRKIAANAESIKILAEALEIEARKHL